VNAAKPVTLVTGASSGIGACCADFLARNGYIVYGASRSATAGEGVAPLRMDVTSDASVHEACQQVLEREGRLDVLINSAGIAIAGSVEDTSIEEARLQFEANFFGVLRVCRAALPVMRQQGRGYIVNIGSIGGLIGIPYQGMYSASKFALEGLTECLRMEVRDFGIRVVLIEPGDHRTALTANRRVLASGSAYRTRFERAVGRMAADEQRGPLPDEIARLVHRAICAENPPLRYTVGPRSQRAAVWLKRLAPYRVVERVVADYYK
jgi:NAD(P)-dependent dehydrogenase (short-subunit alcohol dehydrogenase family)